MNSLVRLNPPNPVAEKRPARAVPTTFNDADNSFEVCWTTGAAVLRSDWLDGEYYNETLSVEPGALRLDRLNDSAPLLDSHRQGELAAVIGSVVPGSIRLEGGKGYARVRLADCADVEAIAAKVRDGHLNKVSVGYQVHAFERIEVEGQRPELRAIDWEPLEISLVAVPADPGARIRSEEPKMKAQTSRTADPAAPPAPVMRGTDDVTAKFVRATARSLGFDDAVTLNLVEAYTDEPYTRAEFLSDMVARVAHTRDGKGTHRSIPSIDAGGEFDGSGGDPAARLATRMRGAIYARMAGKPPAEESREFMGASMIDMARGLLTARGERAQWLSPSKVFERHGALTTSDFPKMIDGALNVYLTEQYAVSPSPLRVLAKSREVNDFRDIKALSIGGAPALLVVEENAEYSFGALNESIESYRVATYGKILSLSRQLIINDNLGAFIEAGAWYARSAARSRADAIAAIINSNVPLADGKAMFHADHGNLAAAGAPLTVASLSARALLCAHKRIATENR